MDREPRKFGYLRDPLYLWCVVLYVVNRFVVKPNCGIVFFHAYLNDVICIGFILPPMLWLLRRLKLRSHDGAPDFREIVIPLVMISWAFEIYLPNTERFREVTVSDPFDIVAYAFGAVVAGAFWHFHYRKTTNPHSSR